MISTAGELPFWLWPNNDGKIIKNNLFLNLSEIDAAGIYVFNDSRAFIKVGTTLLAGIANESYFQPNQLSAKLNINSWELNAGFYRDKFGVKGNIGHAVVRKGMLTYVEHFGTYAKPYKHNKKYVFGLIETLYYGERLPFALGISFAADASNAVSNKAGFQLKLSKEWQIVMIILKITDFLPTFVLSCAFLALTCMKIRKDIIELFILILTPVHHRFINYCLTSLLTNSFI